MDLEMSVRGRYRLEGECSDYCGDDDGDGDGGGGSKKRRRTYAGNSTISFMTFICRHHYKIC